MARVQFSSEAEEILGKLAGSIFQDSYFGMQVRGLPRPKNPQTHLQQLRRGNFRFLSAGWRDLTTADKNTWIAEAGTEPEALRLYIGNNINRLLVGLDITSTYTSTPVPDGLELLIASLTATAFDVIATGAITTVPAGCRLLLYATFAARPTRIFTNPSNYQPIQYFDEGTDLSTITSILTAWIAHYGAMKVNIRICIKTAVIDKTSGNRSAEFINCAVNIIMQTLQQAYDASVAAAESPQIFAISDDPGQIIGFARSNVAETIIAVLDIQFDTLTAGVVDFTTSKSATSTLHSAGLIEFNASESLYQFVNVLEFADNAAAVAAGLAQGCIYRTGDDLKIVHA